MSQLLQGRAGSNGRLSTSNGVGAPASFNNGIPFDAGGDISIALAGAITTHHQGIPYTAQSRIAASTGPVSSVQSGAMPIDAAGRLVIQALAVDHFQCGVPYTAADSISSN